MSDTHTPGWCEERYLNKHFQWGHCVFCSSNRRHWLKASEIGKGCWENWHGLVKGSLVPHINSKQTSTPGRKDILLHCRLKKGKKKKTTTKKCTKATSGFIFKGCKGNGGTSVLIYGLFESSLSLFLPLILSTFTLSLIWEQTSSQRQNQACLIWLMLGYVMVRKTHKKETNRTTSLIFYFCQPCFLFEPCCLLEKNNIC